MQWFCVESSFLGECLWSLPVVFWKVTMTSLQSSVLPLPVPNWWVQLFIAKLAVERQNLLAWHLTSCLLLVLFHSCCTFLWKIWVHGITDNLYTIRFKNSRGAEKRPLSLGSDILHKYYRIKGWRCSEQLSLYWSWWSVVRVEPGSIFQDSFSKSWWFLFAQPVPRCPCSQHPCCALSRFSVQLPVLTYEILN